MYIGIDFDGTCVTHSYPYIGKDIGSIPVLRKLVEKGHKLILFTMRSEKTLADAVRWFKENEIPLFGIQTNPTQVSWTKSPKAYCNLYIDDAGLGCPLKWDKDLSDRGFVDWFSAEQMLVKLGYL